MKKVINTLKRPFHNLWNWGTLDIEHQESEGQKELAQSLQLPRKCNSPHGGNAVEFYHKMGIKTYPTSKGDDLFIGVKLPDGWKKKETGHYLWSDLVDDKGVIRANIFYKAASYDRDAFINFIDQAAIGT